MNVLALAGMGGIFDMGKNCQGNAALGSLGLTLAHGHGLRFSGGCTRDGGQQRVDFLSSCIDGVGLRLNG